MDTGEDGWLDWMVIGPKLFFAASMHSREGVAISASVGAGPHARSRVDVPQRAMPVDIPCRMLAVGVGPHRCTMLILRWLCSSDHIVAATRAVPTMSLRASDGNRRGARGARAF